MTLKIKRRRPRKVLTPAQAKYKFSPGYSNRAKAYARKKYRQDQGAAYELVGATVLRALEHLDLDAETLPVINQLTAKTEALPVFRLQYVAKLLNVSYQTIWRWTTETQQLPMPVLVENSRGREYPVYHLEEIRVMVRTLGEHLKSFKYYRKDHEHTKAKVYTQVDALRALNFKVSGDNKHGYQTVGQSPRKKTIRKKPDGKRRSG